MLDWLSGNLATILICLALAGIVVGIVVSMVRNRKRGRSSCGCGCSDCPMSGSCGGSNAPGKNAK